LTPIDVPTLGPVLPEIRGFFGVSEPGAGLFVTLSAVPGVVPAPAVSAAGAAVVLAVTARYR
jgi:predicted MFS family arabinose efflux permease